MKILKAFRGMIINVIVVFYAAMIFILFIQVVMRYIFNAPTVWAEELGRYLFVWMTILAAGFGITERVHIGIDTLVCKLNPTARKIVKIISNVVVSVFLIFLIIKGSQLSQIAWAYSAYTMSFVKIGYVYAAIPTGALLMLISTIMVIMEDIKSMEKDNMPTGGGTHE